MLHSTNTFAGPVILGIVVLCALCIESYNGGFSDGIRSVKPDSMESEAAQRRAHKWHERLGIALLVTAACAFMLNRCSQ